MGTWLLTDPGWWSEEAEVEAEAPPPGPSAVRELREKAEAALALAPTSCPVALSATSCCVRHRGMHEAT